MKKNSLFVSLLFLICSIAQAQEIKDAFYKAVDYCNCKVTYAYLNQFTSLMPFDKPEKKSFENIKTNLSNCEIGKSIEYSQLSDLLNNNNFKYSNQKVSALIDRIKTSYNDNLTKDDAINKIIEGIYSNKELEPTIGKYSDITKLKEQLFNDLNKYLTASPTVSSEQDPEAIQQTAKVDSPEKVTTEKLQFSIESLKKQVEESKQHWYSPNWIAIIIAVILFAVVLFWFSEKYYYLKAKVEGYRNESKSGPKQNINWNQIPPSNNNARELAEYKKSIEQQLEGVILVVESLRTEMTYQNQKTKGQESISYNPQQPMEAQQKFEVFFASIPNKDGSFNLNAVTNSINPTASFYKFTITDSHSQKATFEFLNEERAIKDATNAPERILRPVCKINNALNQNAKRIRTVTPGTVIKQNDKWVLDFPAEIEYE